MTGQTAKRVDEGESELAMGALDADSSARIDAHLERAQEAVEGDEKDFHLRHARQLLEACTER